MVEDLRVDGITTRIKLFSGALVLNYATVEPLVDFNKLYEVLVINGTY